MTIDPLSVEESLKQLEIKWAAQGPFSGVVGFSMGGSMAAVIAALPNRFPGCRFIVTAGSPDVDIQALMRSGVCGFLNDLNGEIPHSICSFHFAGALDTAVPIPLSKRLAARFNHTNSVFVEHDQGHCFPSKAALVDQCIEFIETILLSLSSLSSMEPRSEAGAADDVSGSHAAKTGHRKPSVEDMQAQVDEIEVLSSMYPDDVKLFRGQSIEKADPIDISQYVAGGISSEEDIVVVCLNPLDELHNIPKRWTGQLSLSFRRPYNYPSEVSPKVELHVGKLSLHDISSTIQTSLLQAVYDTSLTCIGIPSITICVQAANDWLCSCDSASTTAAKVTESVQSAAGLSKICETDADNLLLDDIELDEKATSELIRNVSELAGKIVSGIRRNGGRPDSVCLNDGIFEASASARGVWNYTVGLVGKPSAGKSTFYNVATRAALSRDGRLMAEVAPHPFTTIEPNIGPGWWSSSTENLHYVAESGQAITRGAKYGRDPNGNRYLPLVVKDVAGLVPGAYKGRGKGNKFLGDLCDADVLVHVVDASGRSDRDGNVVDELSNGSTPLEDAYWIREELHRWIYGNVRSKWASVAKKGTDSAIHRLLQLFSGYQGPKSCILSAIAHSELDVSQISKWSSYDLHKLVAIYLSIRFPTCLALNKIDAMNDFQITQIPIWQTEIEAHGEVAVPVCAKLESLVLASRACKAGNSDTFHKAQEEIDANQLNDLVLSKFGSAAVRGVLTAISAAVMLRPPTLCYPVSDVSTELPVGWHAGASLGALSDLDDKDNSSCGLDGLSNCRLVDCILMKPGSTIEDVYDALKRGVLEHSRISGDFVRAEAKSLDPLSRKKQLGRDAVLNESNCIVRIQTNRKSVWQMEAKITTVPNSF